VTWDTQQYLKFGDERTQPCRDLVHRIALNNVRSIIDLGCGPGNSTEVLRSRWPDAEIIGLDNSPEMIAKARQARPDDRWTIGDISKWAEEGGTQFDLVFSNAALHWVPDQRAIFPRLLTRSSGALAVQMPGNTDGAAYGLIRTLADSAQWHRFLADVPNSQAQGVSVYYDLLRPLVQHLDLWSTEYVHVMDNAEAIVEWYKGSGLRPYLDALPDDTQRARFTSEYLDGIRDSYPPRPDGRVLFPFRRVFLVAYL
jgi:trans-aconitate 2-methyltransferase